MNNFKLSGARLARHWWFAVLLAMLLVATAVAATPQGHTAIDNVVSDTGSYYVYLSIIFNS